MLVYFSVTVSFLRPKATGSGWPDTQIRPRQWRKSNQNSNKELTVVLNVVAAELVLVKLTKNRTKLKGKNDHEVDSFDYNEDENEKEKKKRLASFR